MTLRAYRPQMSDLAEPGVSGARKARTPTVPQRAPRPAAERTLSTHEAARALGKSAQTVRDYIGQGKLSAVTDPLNGRLRIPLSELARLGVAPPSVASVDDEVGRLAASLAAGLTERLEDAVANAVRSADATAVTQVVLAALREHERSSTQAELASTRAALMRLATARWWQRRAIRRALRRDGLI
jgi:hypothetical protein